MRWARGHNPTPSTPALLIFPLSERLPSAATWHGMAFHCAGGLPFRGTTAPQVHNHERQPHATGDRPGTAIHFRSERHQTSVRGQSLSLAAEPCPQCHAWSPNAVSHLAVRRQLTPVWPAAPTVRMNCVWNTSGLHRRHRSNGCNLNFLICASG